MLRNNDREIDPAMRDRITSALTQLDGDDRTFLDPPDGLWDRIVSSVAAGAAGDAMHSTSVVSYSIDAADVVISVDDGWDAFASENDATDLTGMVSAAPIWDSFNSDEVRDLWRMLVEQVRARQTAAHVPIRCDAPHVRRWFDITVTPESAGVVNFRSVLVFEEPRSDVALLDAGTERNTQAEAVPVCSWCARGQSGSKWLDIEDLVRESRLLESEMPSVSHGICPTCRDLMTAELAVVQGSPTA